MVKRFIILIMLIFFCGCTLKFPGVMTSVQSAKDQDSELYVIIKYEEPRAVAVYKKAEDGAYRLVNPELVHYNHKEEIKQGG